MTADTERTTLIFVHTLLLEYVPNNKETFHIRGNMIRVMPRKKANGGYTQEKYLPNKWNKSLSIGWVVIKFLQVPLMMLYGSWANIHGCCEGKCCCR